MIIGRCSSVQFLAVAAIVVITPGVDMAVVTRNALMYGRRAAVMTAFGINVGILLWVMAAALGLAAVVSTSATAFAAIKLAGAAYLVYLGLQALRSARADGVESQPIPARLPAVGWPSVKGSSATFSTLRSRSSLPVSCLSSSARTARPATCFCLDCCSTRWALAGFSCYAPSGARTERPRSTARQAYARPHQRVRTGCFCSRLTTRVRKALGGR